MPNKKINDALIVVRSIGILFSLWTLVQIFIGVYHVSHTASFELNKTESIMILVPTIWPPLTLSILFLLPWKRIKNNKVWTSLFVVLNIAALVDMILIYKFAMNLNILLSLFVILIIVMQIISIAIIKQMSIVTVEKSEASQN